MSDSQSIVIEKLITTRKLSEMTGIPIGTFENWRVTGEAGPAYVKLGDRDKSGARYKLSDVQAWFASLRRVVPVNQQEVNEAAARHAEGA
jgi:hypothetical protein